MFFSDFVVKSYVFQVSYEMRCMAFFLPGFLGLFRVVFFDVGTRCIPFGCEGPILRYGMSDTEVVGCYLVCMLPSVGKLFELLVYKHMFKDLKRMCPKYDSFSSKP
jgi:hypothetical protein